MKQIRYWLEHKGIKVFFWLSLATLGVLVWLSYQPTTVPSPGEQQSNPLPWLADVCMAYVGAYFFHYLVVVLPGRNRLESRLKTLQTPLTAIAFNGLDMVRELERIAQCPHRRVTQAHLRVVLSQLSFNTHLRTHFSERMDRARAAYLAIVPYAADLPLDLQERLQEENQHLAHGVFNLEPEKRETLVYLARLRENDDDDAFRLDAWLPSIFRYYETTEAVRLLLGEYLPSSRGYREGERTTEHGKKPRPRPGRSADMFGLHRKPEYPYWTYPEDRTDELTQR